MTASGGRGHVQDAWETANDAWLLCAHHGEHAKFWIGKNPSIFRPIGCERILCGLKTGFFLSVLWPSTTVKGDIVSLYVDGNVAGNWVDTFVAATGHWPFFTCPTANSKNG